MAERKDLRQGPPGVMRPAPDLEGVRRATDDVGSLPVPRSVREEKGERLPPYRGAPLDTERGLLPGARRPVLPSRPGTEIEPPPADAREEEALLRRTHSRAALTPEALARALGRVGWSRDPQRGREFGPPLPGERGQEGGD
jgi:hypothetical protein